MKLLLLAVSLFISLSLVSAIGLDNPNIPLVKTEVIDTNISVDSANNWDTSDHGKLNSTSSLMHNWLGGLQGGNSGEYFHLNSSVYTYLMSNIFTWITLSDVNNIHDQDLNTTDNVTFESVTAETGNFTDIYVSNNTIYIGEVKLSSSNETLYIDSGNGTVVADYFEGDGSRLTGINLSGVNGSATFGDNLTVEGFLIVNNDSYLTDVYAENFYGTYDWIAQFPWFNFNGTYLSFNETNLNQRLANISIENMSAAGNDNSVQYNNEGKISGNNKFTYDNDTSDLHINGSITVSDNERADWNTDYQIMQVGSASIASENGVDDIAHVLSNAYIDGAGTWRRIASGYAGRVYMYGDEYRIYSASTGAANSTITWRYVSMFGSYSGGSNVKIEMNPGKRDGYFSIDGDINDDIFYVEICMTTLT